MVNMHNRLNNLSRFLTGTILFFLVSSNCIAATYKWVDAEGNTQYSQQPPPDGAEAETVAPPPKVDTDKAVGDLEKQQEQFKKQDEDKSKQAEETQKTGEDLAQQKKRCEQAKDKLAKMQRPRISVTGEDGNRKRLSEDERQTAINDANKSIAELCK